MSLSLALLSFAICAIAAPAPAITPASFQLWRFSDLKARGVCNSRAQLKLMIELYGFPPGKMLTPNARVWTQAEVIAFYESRTSELRDVSFLHKSKGRRGRPPKNKQKQKRAAVEVTQ